MGVVVHFMVRASMMASVDRELMRRTERPPLGPPPRRDGPPDGAERDPFRPGGPGPRPEEGDPRLRVRLYAPDGQPLNLDPQGVPLDPAAIPRAANGEAVFATVRTDGEEIRVLTRPFPPRGPARGVVQAPYPLADVHRAIAGLDGALLALSPVALLLAGLGGAALTNRMVRPVRGMARTASQLGAEDLSRRLPIEGEDEFADLAITFNGMLDRLEGAFGEQRRLVGELQRMIERERQFTADASHELRTPLTVIRANTSLCLSGQPSPEEYRESMEDIDRASASMARLVQDLLTLARSDAGRLGSDRERVPVRDLLVRAADMAPPGPRAHILVGEVDPTLTIEANEDELTRVLTNLLENALRHTPADGTVSLTALRLRGQVELRVSDTGCGIPAEHLPRLGERFYRVDASRTRPSGGAGLGLSICRSIVDAHGGTLHIESQVGRGTTVAVRIPSAQPRHSGSD
jgi:signal transduction histidine kinase